MATCAWHVDAVVAASAAEHAKPIATAPRLLVRINSPSLSLTARARLRPENITARQTSYAMSAGPCSIAIDNSAFEC